MNLSRRLLLPLLIGTPLCAWVIPLPIRGIAALAAVSFRAVDLLFIGFFLLLGLLLFAYPLVAWIGLKPWPKPAKALTMVLIGAAGRGAMAAALVLNLVFVPLGVIPGAVAAAVWVSLNLDLLTLSPPGASHV